MAKDKLSNGMKYGRSDLDRIGLFSEAAYISTGEAYRKNNDVSLDYRSRGRQFQVLPPKIGQDAHYNRIFENEPYTDLVVLRRRYRLKEKEKNIAGVPFKPSSVPPKPSGKGSHWGTIEQQWPTLKKDLPVITKKEDEITHKGLPEPRNIVTRPPKKGYPDVTIGKPHEYISDPYDRTESISRVEREENKKKNLGTRPFVTSSSSQDFFNKFICLNVDDENRAGKSGNLATGHRNDNKLPSIVPFKPTSKCGFTINPYPTYETPKFVNHTDDKRASPKLDAIFKPTGKPGSYPIRSIVEVNCPLAPPKWLQDTLRNVVIQAD